MISRCSQFAVLAYCLIFFSCSGTRNKESRKQIFPTSLIESNKFKVIVQDLDSLLKYDDLRMELLAETFSSTSLALGSDWKKAKTTVWSVNNSATYVPIPNMLWSATMDGNQVACMHFVTDNEMYTIIVEDPNQKAVAKLDTILSQISLK